MVPTITIKHDPETWGEDSKYFKPEMFSKGIAKATDGPVSPSYVHVPLLLLTVQPQHGAHLILKNIF
ncbi:hypothetical protein RHGRI_018225 [Rhododendron griersonianum]|uniref:Uncharacterized protein n=1 Tax=Rhododendron griersonianum TaxID=479676 RepID=A0AAV6K0U1_9ERIC|nr:hypothetical protein RHGRI_018225 [Rhododendron griersonianum]